MKMQLNASRRVDEMKLSTTDGEPTALDRSEKNKATRNNFSLKKKFMLIRPGYFRR